jgi:hypothetical protein
MDLNQIIQIALTDKIDEDDSCDIDGTNIEEILRGCLINYRSSFTTYKKPSHLVSLRRRKPINHMSEDMDSFLEKTKYRKAKTFDALFALPKRTHKR